MNTIFKIRAKKYFRFFICVFFVFSCDEFVEIDPPRTDLVRATVFTSDETAEAAVADIYYTMKTSGFAAGSRSSISVFGSISSDDLIFYGRNSVLEYKQFNDNTLQVNNLLIANLWSGIYNIIYKCNAVIEGLMASSTVTENKKNGIVGEAKFIRAFCHFHLLNLWGDVPLIVSTDYKTNNLMLRTPRDQVYQQIIMDLKDSQSLLTNDYSISKNERVRANKAAATALLARVYLYNQDWSNAEIEATTIINDSSQFSLEQDLTIVFRTTSHEAIFQLWSEQYPNEYATFLIHPSIGPLLGALNPQLVDNFEVGDQRKIAWVTSVAYGGTNYLGSNKYKSFAIPPDDYSTVLRLAEQYLIRAEARVQLNNLPEAIADINVIRNRAGLVNTISTTQADLLNDVMRERRLELFAEWGHRWFDLKRTGQADVVLGLAKPEWNTEDVLYPIPEIQLISNPGMTQNPN